MLPSRGPLAISIPGITGVSVPAATTGTEVRYRWPADYKLSAIDFGVRSGLQLHLANMRLRMTDVHNSAIELASSGSGQDTLRSIEGLLMRGITPIGRTFGGGRFMAFQRVVRAGDIWLFQVFNANAAVDVIPELFFRLEVAPPHPGSMRAA